MPQYTRLIFVSRLSSIGDVLISLRALHLLAVNGYFPVLVTSKSNAAIPDILPSLNSVIGFEKGEELDFYSQKAQLSPLEFKDLIRTLPVEKKPLFLDLQKTPRSKRARREIQKRFSYERVYSVSKRSWYRFFLIVMAYLCFSQRSRQKSMDMASLETIKDLQERLIQKIIQKDGKIFVPLTKETFFSKPPLPSSSLLPAALGPYICLFTGASGFIKMCPKEKFRELMDYVLEKTDLNIVLCGSQSEIKIGDYLDFPKNTRVFNLIHKTDLSVTLSFIANARYVVSNDSFAAHGAQSFGVPATVIFGATTPKFGFAPKAKNIQVEYLNLACSPCTRHGKSGCSFQNLKCLTGISAQGVFENLKAQALL
jgi:ADP-heptose:LPS heptosyltransferase